MCYSELGVICPREKPLAEWLRASAWLGAKVRAFPAVLRERAVTATAAPLRIPLEPSWLSVCRRNLHTHLLTLTHLHQLSGVSPSA